MVEPLNKPGVLCTWREGTGEIETTALQRPPVENA